MNNQQKSIDILDLVILTLSVYVIGALAVETFADISPETSRLLWLIDNGICVIFMAEFFYRLKTAENRWAYLKWGWIDFIASIPSVMFLRYGRAIRVIRILKVLRLIRSAKIIFNILFKHKAKGSFSIALLFSLLMIIFSSIVILITETGL